ncbi:hypothetical protein TNCV_3191471 [Trichonephila clavipes]|nr:hypothetical protein TNCV_3191471 [Trichonephila clavipes]
MGKGLSDMSLSVALSTLHVVERFSSVSLQFLGSIPWGWSGAANLSSVSTNTREGLRLDAKGCGSTLDQSPSSPNYYYPQTVRHWTSTDSISIVPLYIVDRQWCENVTPLQSSDEFVTLTTRPP